LFVGSGCRCRFNNFEKSFAPARHKSRVAAVISMQRSLRGPLRPLCCCSPLTCVCTGRDLPGLSCILAILRKRRLPCCATAMVYAFRPSGR
jgi:hypothetical protein